MVSSSIQCLSQVCLTSSALNLPNRYLSTKFLTIAAVLKNTLLTYTHSFSFHKRERRLAGVLTNQDGSLPMIHLLLKIVVVDAKVLFFAVEIFEESQVLLSVL